MTEFSELLPAEMKMHVDHQIKFLSSDTGDCVLVCRFEQQKRKSRLTRQRFICFWPLIARVIVKIKRRTPTGPHCPPLTRLRVVMLRLIFSNTIKTPRFHVHLPNMSQRPPITSWMRSLCLTGRRVVESSDFASSGRCAGGLFR
jgi:hypothetical protein